MCLNRNKKSVTIDMKQNEGKEILNDLARNSDIFIQNFPPLTAQKLKIDYENM